MESKIILKPMISEKSYALANAQNKYTFMVKDDATKIEVWHAIEKLYKVTVESVNTTVRVGKIKRDFVKFKKFRQHDAKKAIVQLKKGDKIEEFLNIK
jgi:large subunit ribosomal protein L23